MLAAAVAVYLAFIVSFQGCAQAQGHSKQLPKLKEFVWFETPNMEAVPTYQQTVPTYQHEESDLVCNFPLIEWKGGNCERDRFASSQKLEDSVWFEAPDVKSYQPKTDIEDVSKPETRKTKTEENLWKSEDQLFAEYLFANQLL